MQAFYRALSGIVLELSKAQVCLGAKENVDLWSSLFPVFLDSEYLSSQAKMEFIRRLEKRTKNYSSDFKTLGIDVKAIEMKSGRSTRRGSCRRAYPKRIRLFASRQFLHRGRSASVAISVPKLATQGWCCRTLCKNIPNVESHITLGASAFQCLNLAYYGLALLIAERAPKLHWRRANLRQSGLPVVVSNIGSLGDAWESEVAAAFEQVL